jgi:hypothetical protein
MRGLVQRTGIVRKLGKLTLIGSLIWPSAYRMSEPRKGDVGQESRPTVAAKPRFGLASDKVRVLRERTTTLEVGELRKDVTASLGPPDHQELLGPKKGRDWKCRGLLYYVSLVDEVPGNANDVKVDSCFSGKGIN